MENLKGVKSTLVRNDLNSAKINGSMSSPSTIFAMINPTHLNRITLWALNNLMSGYTMDIFLVPHIKCNHNMSPLTIEHAGVWSTLNKVVSVSNTYVKHMAHKASFYNKTNQGLMAFFCLRGDVGLSNKKSSSNDPMKILQYKWSMWECRPYTPMHW